MLVSSSANDLLQLARAGQGLDVFDFPVELEPVLQQLDSRLQYQKPIDDGRSPSFLRRLFTTKQSVNLRSNDSVGLENNLSLLPRKSPAVPIVSFVVNLPNELKVSIEQTAQLYECLSNTAPYSSFEIIGTSGTITFQITCPETAKSDIFAQLKNHLPSVNFRESEDLLATHLQSDPTSEIVIFDFGLSRGWFVPLPCGRNSSIDTLLPLIACFEELVDDETTCLQVLWSRTRQNWTRTAKAAILDRNGQLVFSGLQDHLQSIKEKLSRPLLAVQIRLIVKSNSTEKSMQIARRTAAFFKQFSSQGNELILLQNEERQDKSIHLRSVLTRTTFRCGMLFSAQELSAITHLPGDAIKSPKLKRDENCTKPAPEFATKGNVILGENCHAGQRRIIKLSNEQRLKHIWITGASGCGKSTLITHLAEIDSTAGHGFIVLDPHDLINGIMARIPTNRLQDVILFDPADEDFPIGFNPLHANSELERTLLASDLVAIFQRFWSSQGDIISNVLHNSILTFLASETGGTLIDLKHFLVDRKFQNSFLETVPDEDLRFYWQREFPSLAKRITPLLTRLNLFLRSRIIRNILGQKDSRLDFRRIIDERKILLIKLTHGAIGEEHSRLLASLIIAKLYQAALSRQNVNEDKRPPCFVFLDEAHHYFSLPSTALLLSGGRKYGISILASHQDTQQIADADILSSLTTNCYTRICFRGDTDAERLAKAFSFFTSDQLKNLGVGEAICRFEQSRYDFNLKTLPLAPIDPKTAEQRQRAIVEQTRTNYARPKAEIEEEIRNGRQVQTDSVSAPKPNQNDIQVEAVRAGSELGSDRPEKNFLTSADASDTPRLKHGQGGAHHQELQAVIKRMAESYGIQAEIEKDVLNGTGRIDVSLEKGGVKIGCEVCVTTTDYETRNIQKCLAAGYDYAVVVVSNQKKIRLIDSKIKAELSIEQLGNVKVLSLATLLSFLRELTAPKEAVRKNTEKPTGQRLNFAEACDFFSVKASTLYRWLREGRVPFYRPGREYQFDRDELVLIGRHDLSGKRKASVTLSPLKIDKKAPKSKKERDSRYRKLLRLD
ncbi:hypothetical protein BH20ACI2_BH20ACI2_02100 [soil metagenome]